MKLFIANGTHQKQLFQYRVLGNKQVRQQQIEVGGQVQLSGELTKPQIDAIVKHHGIYGMIEVDEIQDENRPAPMAYSVDRQFTSDEILNLTKRNQGILVARGKQVRKDAAVVLASELGRAAQESGTNLDLGQTEVIIEEQQNRAAPKEELLEETVVVQTGEEGEGGKDRDTTTGNRSRSNRRRS